jgi:hypothetical protein
VTDEMYTGATPEQVRRKRGIRAIHRTVVVKPSGDDHPLLRRHAGHAATFLASTGAALTSRTANHPVSRKVNVVAGTEVKRPTPINPIANEQPQAT